MSEQNKPTVFRGRGAVSNETSRHVESGRESIDDGWFQQQQDAPRTEIFTDTSRSIISHNQSPDVPFDYSINPYKGCEHGCPYCFARPTHAWLDLSPGLDFETKIFVKHDADSLLKKVFNKASYQPATIALGANTDPYQPIERKLGITRRILEVMREYHHPVSIITKSALIERDLDLLAELANENLVQVLISVTTLDRKLAQRLEPRAAMPEKRLQALEKLSARGIPSGALFAPVIPGLNDHEIEQVLQKVAATGARNASMILLRLPREVEQIFIEWLQAHYPEKAQKIISLIRSCRQGRMYDARPGLRMTGTGDYAALLQQRFKLAARQQGLLPGESCSSLATDIFRRHDIAQADFGF